MIQFAALKLPELIPYEVLINPGCPIAPEVSEIHGITTESVVNAPSFGDIADDAYWFSTAPYYYGDTEGERLPLLVGYNLRSFDVEILRNEFEREGLVFPGLNTPIIDACELFYRMEPRDLKGALKFYLEEEHETAHSAMSDVLGTIKVLCAQLKHYQGLPHDPQEFDSLTQREKKPNWIDQLGKLQWWHGEATIMFGNKWKGQTLRDVYRRDRGYFYWMLRSEFSSEIKDIIQEAVQGRFPQKKL